MNVLERLADTIAELLRADETRVLLGEDVVDGGLVGLSRRAAEDEALRSRLLATPLSTSAAVSHAAGLALGGARPIVLTPSASTLVEALPAVRELARLRQRTRGGPAATVPVLMVAPCGPGFGLGGDWAACPDAQLCAVPGLRVVVGGDAGRLDGLLRGAAGFGAGPDPIALLLPRELLLRKLPEGSAPGEAPSLSIEEARVVESGDAATVFAWGPALERATRAAREASRTLERAIEVVDVGSLAPLDEPTLLAAAQKTGKLVIAHAGPTSLGVGGELAALFADRAILHLDAPVLRVGGSSDLAGDEHRSVPSVAAITDAILTVATY